MRFTEEEEKRTINDGAKVLHIAQVIVRRVLLRADCFNNLSAELLEKFRVLCEEVDGKSEG